MAKGLDDDLETVRELANVLMETGLTEVELERGGLRLRVARQVTTNVVEQAPAPVIAAAPAGQAPAPAQPAAVPAPSKGEAIKSPMVGTAYLSASPGSAPFVEVGSDVQAGQTLMIVEAMKTMNEIKAPRAGRVAEVLARNAEPVEFDEPLVILEA